MPGELQQSPAVGVVQEIGGLKAYVSGPANSNRAILLISDSTGYEAPNFRSPADKIAGQGFLVVAPDFFYGDPTKYWQPGFDIQARKKLHNPDQGCEDAKSVIAALIEQGVTCIGVGGLCWGGVVAAKLAKSPDIIQAVVSLYPGYLKSDDLKVAPADANVPIAFLLPEENVTSLPKQYKQIKEISAAKTKMSSFVKIYPGASHGFGLKYSVKDKTAVKRVGEPKCESVPHRLYERGETSL